MNGSLGNILLVWDRVGDYHVARFKALESAFEGGEVWLADLGGADNLYGWKNSVADHPNYCAFSSISVEHGDVWSRFSNFRKLVRKVDIQYIGLAGYGRVEYILMLIWSALNGKKVILFAESWYGNSKLLNLFKGIFLKWTCHGFLVSGIRAQQHFNQKLGLEFGKIETGYSVVDNHHFVSDKSVEKENILLCVARFAPEKNLELLISAFQKSDLKNTWKLSIVGGGPLKEKLKALVNKDVDIQFHDWLSYQALPFLYDQARFFILPSTFEPWGLVVNEAMSAGLPVVISTACGCAPDLVDPDNGFQFDASHEISLVEKLNKIYSLSDLQISKMGVASTNKIKAFTPQVWAKNFLKLALS